MHFSKSLYGSKWAITIRTVSIESTLLLLLVICITSLIVYNDFPDVFHIFSRTERHLEELKRYEVY